eukprot:PRCOL_00006276-RA
MALATVLGAVFVSKTQANATLMKELEAELGPGVRKFKRAVQMRYLKRELDAGRGAKALREMEQDARDRDLLGRGFIINAATANPKDYEAAKARQAARRKRYEERTGKDVVDLNLQRLFLPPARVIKERGLLGAIAAMYEEEGL